ncbi:MAG: thioredoxin family protein [Stigonema ocellatum SAG 48.90 = DSM 106950]|nr:thioredoxin family protein [Stigonema ocellatum SAG 48.90 = DSM 106950]
MSILETIYTPIGSYAPDFELPGIDSQVHHLSRYLEKFRAVAVIAMCNQCPYVELYLGRLKNIQAEFGTQSFTLIGMNGSDANTNPLENFDNMKVFARTHELNFPYLWDSTQDVTQSFGVSKTPMAFLIDGDGIVRYKGQIDDNPYNSPEVVGNHYLKRAIASLFKKEEIDPAETEPEGTSLTWRK